MKNESTYIERAEKSKLKVMSGLIDSGMTEFDRGVGRVGQAGREIVQGINEIWQAGRKFHEAEEINQFEFKNWHDESGDWKADQIRRVKMEVAKKIYRGMPQTAKHLDECKPALQLVFETAGLLAKTKRLEPQVYHGEKNFWNEMVVKIATIESIFDELEKTRPIFEWKENELEKFVETTRLLNEKHLMAVEILKKRNHDD